MSEPRSEPDGHKDPLSALAERALDLLVFAPAGAVLSALEDVPGMAARGRAVIEQEVRNAHLVGQFAVGAGQRRLQHRLGRLTGSASRTATGGPHRADEQAQPGSGEERRPAPEAGAREAATAEVADEPPAFEPRMPAPATAAEEERETTAAGTAGSAGTPTAAEAAEAATTADHAIPGYDTLSASQVVRRLDGLGPDELAAVFRHESATRGRRTILHRAQQLLGSAAPPEA